MLNKKLSLTLAFSIVSIGLAPSAHANVQLESDVRVPSVAGVQWSGKLEGEITLDDTFRPIAYTMSAADMATLLTAAALPPVNSSETDPQTGKTHQTVLDHICLVGNSQSYPAIPHFCFQRDPRTQDYRGQIDFFGLNDEFYNGGPAQLQPEATYASYWNGTPGFSQDLHGKPVANSYASIGRVKNFTSDLSLPLSEVTKVESISRDALDDNDMAQTFDRLQHYCDFETQREGFAAFLCDHLNTPAFSTRLKLRLQFNDQDGVARNFDYDHFPAIYSCRFFLSDQPDCFEAGDDQVSWTKWLNEGSYNFAADIAKGGSKDKTAHFAQINGLIAKTSDTQPSLDISRGNASRVEAK